MRHLPTAVVALGIASLCWTAHGQVYKTSFEEGDKLPTGWRPSSPDKCLWVTDRAHTGKRCVAVIGTDHDSYLWQTTDLPFEPGRFYRMTFYYRLDRTGKKGCSTSGAGFAYQDFQPGAEWGQAEIVYQAPHQSHSCHLRLGQWHLPGTVYFDDVVRERGAMAYCKQGGIVLGKDERIEGGRYLFKTDLRTPYSNCFRVVDEQKLTYHSGWLEFRDKTFLIYRFQIGTHEQKSAKIKLAIRRFAKGAGTVCVSKDKTKWREIARLSADGDPQYDLPGDLFPAKQLYLRIGVDGGTSYNLNQFEYTAELGGSPPDMVGYSKWFRGKMLTVDTGPMQLTFEEGRPALVEMGRNGVSVGRIGCAVAQFEKDGLGYKKTGVGLAEADCVKSVEVKEKSDGHCVVDVTIERTESEETRRCFEAVFRIDAFAGRDWVRCRLVSVKNTDTVAYDLRGLCYFVQPADPASAKPVNFGTCAGWILEDGILGALSLKESAFGFAFRQQEGRASGDVTRTAAERLAVDQVSGVAEPELIVYLAKGKDGRAAFEAAHRIRALLTKPSGEIPSGDIRYAEESETQLDPKKAK